MAPSTIGRERTKRRPSSTVCQVAGAVLIACGALLVRLIRITDSSSSAAAARYTVRGPARYSRPPSTGPVITATWKADELSATAWLKLSSGTMFFRIAWVAGIMKARALPNSTRMANTGHTTWLPLSVKPSSSSEHSSCTPMQMAMMLRRL